MVFRLQKKGISAYNAGASYTPGNIFVFKGAWRFGGVNIARLAVNGSKSTLNWLCSLTDFECIQPSSGIFSYSIRITACAPKFPAAMSIFCIFQHSHIERRLLTLKRAAIELTQYSVSISGNMVRTNFGKRVFRTKNKMSKNTEEKWKRKKAKRKWKNGEMEKRGNKKRLRGEIEGRMKKMKTKKGQKKMEERRNRKKRKQKKTERGNWRTDEKNENEKRPKENGRTEKQKKDKREKLSPLLISASDTDFSPSKMQKRHRPPICLHFPCFEKS